MSGKAGDIAGENGVGRGDTAADTICKFRNLEMFKIGRLFTEDFFWNRQTLLTLLQLISIRAGGLKEESL